MLVRKLIDYAVDTPISYNRLRTHGCKTYKYMWKWLYTYYQFFCFNSVQMTCHKITTSIHLDFYIKQFISLLCMILDPCIFMCNQEITHFVGNYSLFLHMHYTCIIAVMGVGLKP